MNRTTRIAIAAGLTVFAVVAVATYLGVTYPRPEPFVPMSANFSNPVDIEGSSSAAAPALTFEDDTDSGLFRSAADTLNIATGGTEQLEIDSSAFTIVPAVELDGDTTLTGDLVLTDQSVTIDGNGDIITPTGAFVSVNCTSAVTCTIADGSTAGQILALYNDGSQTATIDESDYNADTGGDISLTTDDCVMLIWTGSVWTMLTTLISN